MASLLANGKQQYFDNAGLPLVGGQLFTYIAGTTTPKATYADADGVVPNTNPVILNARGEATVFWSGSYKVILKDALGNVIWTVDKVVESNLGSRTSTNGSMVIPPGTTLQRDPNPSSGYLRYNTDLTCYEFYSGGGWASILKTINGAAIPDGGNVNVQPVLVSGANIKTFNGVSVLGAGDIATAIAMVRSTRTVNAQLVAGDIGKFIDITAGTFTQTFDTPANLSSGWFCYIRNNGTGDITIPLSDGVANWIMYPGESRLFECNGANLISTVVCSFIKEYSTSASFVRPPGYATMDVEIWGAGGGGGGGVAANGGTWTGGYGGAGGGYYPRSFTLSELPAGTAVTITIGAGGNGGAAGVNPGAPGGTTSFGSYISASGGNGGIYSQSTSASSATGGVPLGIQNGGTFPYSGTPGGFSPTSSNANPAPQGLVSGAAGGAGGGTANGASYSPAAGGGRGSLIGAAAGATDFTSTVSGTNGFAGGPFQGGGGGGSTSWNSAAAKGGNGGNGGIASGGGGGGTSGATGASTGGTGGTGGNGYAIIRGR